MAKMSIEDWKRLELAMGIFETPHRIASMLFNMLENSGYSVEETLTVARTLSNYAANDNCQTLPQGTQSYHESHSAAA